jgi:hypothetical protein
MTLENYLADQYNKDLQDIQAMEQVLVNVAETFAVSFDDSINFWPIEIRSDEKKSGGRESQGTSAMINAALGKMLGLFTLRDGFNAEKLPFGDEKLEPVLKKSMDALAKNLSDQQCVYSKTFGKNDPLTTSHVIELIRAAKQKDSLKLPPSAETALSNICKVDPANHAAFEAALPLDVKWCTSSAFIALRVVRATRDLGKEFNPLRYREFFESRLHEQLSFSSIPDSRFDPAELAFCLEGLLLCAPEAVDPVLCKRVLAVLLTTQETSAYWRPNRPFVAKPTGEIMLPLSVEGANSLLYSIEVLDSTKLHDTLAGVALPMFRRFWQWLRARKVEINAFDKQCVGWHSEHINEANVIHLWDTSQVVEFLLALRKLIQRHVARETLVYSRVKISEPKSADEWKEITETYEPMSDGSITDLIFDRVRDDFITPWTEGTPENYSILLYGPPGTGKTTIASSIANALKFRLITVTVSDFLGAGGALVEARAKAIFQMLEAQENCVIFFDEIDAFLLDRDSEHYRMQDTLFQFLTPGMLTKINDLRKAQRSIFIIATNYANRIDPAIKRPGRIDRKYLLLSPDMGKRRTIITKALKDFEIGGKQPIDQMAKASVFLGYNEIRGAIQSKANTGGSSLVQAMKDAPRSSGPKHYLARLDRETKFPEDEFIAILKLAKEADALDDIKSDIGALKPKKKKKLSELLKAQPALESVFSELGINV